MFLLDGKTVNTSLNQRDFAAITQFFRKIELSKNGKEFLKTHLQIQQYKNREIFLSTGTICSQLAFILKGQCREYIKKENDREYTYQFYLKQQWIMNGSFMQQCPALGNIQALGQVRLATLSRQAFDTFCKLFPDGKRFRALLAEQVACKHERHLINLLSKNATERYDFLVEYQPELVNAIAGLHLSSFIAVRPESLSRIRSAKINGKNDNG